MAGRPRVVRCAQCHGPGPPCPRPPPGCSQGFQRKEEGEGGGTAGLRQEASRSLHRPPLFTSHWPKFSPSVPPAPSCQPQGWGWWDWPGASWHSQPRLSCRTPLSSPPGLGVLICKTKSAHAHLLGFRAQVGPACPGAWTLSADCRALPGAQQRDERSEARRPQGGEEVVPAVLCAEDLAVWAQPAPPPPGQGQPCVPSPPLTVSSRLPVLQELCSWPLARKQ